MRNLALVAVELVSSDYGRLGPSSLGLETYIYSGGRASLLGFGNINYILR